MQVTSTTNNAGNECLFGRPSFESRHPRKRPSLPEDTHGHHAVTQQANHEARPQSPKQLYHEPSHSRSTPSLEPTFTSTCFLGLSAPVRADFSLTNCAPIAFYELPLTNGSYLTSFLAVVRLVGVVGLGWAPTRMQGQPLLSPARGCAEQSGVMHSPV